ncbi:MAG: DUF2085 domain-containing protein [Chloroflexi bacterium]|nr:DUF2085 domain-containing protein [Chloroflexota bacterium]
MTPLNYRHISNLMAQQPPRRRRLFLLAVVGAMLLLIGFYAVTDVAHLTHNHTLAGADWVGYAVCHRITGRSLAINGRQFPLCARCTGMYLGVFLVFLVLWLGGRLRWSLLPPFPILLTLIGFVGLMGIDGVNSYLHFFPNAPHIYEPRNWLRLLTGMGTGLTMGLITLPMLAQTLWRQPVWQASAAAWRDLLEMVVVAGTAVILLLSNQPTILYVLALASTAGLLIVVTALNTVSLLLVLRRDGRAERAWETAVPLFIGFILALLELSAISLVRFHFTGTMTGLPGL